ncbi:decapping endonuclease targeting mRNA [Polyrhizophydium stewartii]|uniref:Extracellular metalloproteinase n=1 Tax=Polyrhizophydium stewartii TaxID=2732419 RepID=A0ABR4NIT7_9FUNG|nr:hypothetical protein HK105_005877 [Polyrhizophydium stewartii]
MHASRALALVMALAAALAAAAPLPLPPKAKQRTSPSKLPFHFPSSVYEPAKTRRASRKSPSGMLTDKTAANSAVQIAIDHVIAKLGITPAEFKVYNSFTDASGTTHVYGARQANGIRIANHQAAAHVQKGQIVSFSSSFGAVGSFTKARIPKASGKLTADQAIAKAVKKTGIPHNKDFATVAEYVDTGSGILYAYKLQLRDDETHKWIQCWIAADTGEIVHAVDFVKKATYKVVALPKTNPLQGFSPVSNPEDATASPNGWTDASGKTKGNNVDVAKRTAAEVAITYGSSSSGVFDSSWNPSQQPFTAANVQAATVHLFYITNTMHDVMYQYGFTEVAGNFQLNNNGRGGLGNDALVASVQDPNDTDNADFSTPADGQAPLMRMFVFTGTFPLRDGSLESAIPIHEYTHGVSTRLTGGSATTQCLSSDEAAGLGEGWSDFVALVFISKPTDTRTTPIVIGDYVVNDPAGIRWFPYSTDDEINPLRFSDLQTRTEVHDAGEVWVELLWEVYWNLVDKYGFNANLRDAKSTAGNIVALQLVIGGMMAQPCNPTFLQARDAILTADQTYYGGKYKCDIWKGFAKRGAGHVGILVDVVFCQCVPVSERLFDFRHANAVKWDCGFELFIFELVFVLEHISILEHNCGAEFNWFI